MTDDACFVYRAFDRLGVLIYVGMTKNVELRFSQHEKSAAWFSEIATITSERFESRKEAEDHERAVIIAERPQYNIAHHNIRPPSAASWDMLLEDDEAAQLQAAEDAKAKVVTEYNAVRRLLKARCDARMRRAKESENPSPDRR